MIFQGQGLLEIGWFQDKDPIDWSRVEGENGILSMYSRPDRPAAQPVRRDTWIVRAEYTPLSC